MKQTIICAAIVAVVLVGVIGFIEVGATSKGQAGSATSTAAYRLSLCQNGSCAKMDDVILQCGSQGSLTQCALIFSITQK